MSGKAKRGACAGLFVLLGLVGCLAAMAQGFPAWWTQRQVIATEGVTTNDYAAVNAGQLKWFAVNARDELEENLHGGAGAAVLSLVESFSLTNNYLPVNQGQLKHVAACFYDRLIEVGYTNAYPWTTNTADDADFASANIGQVKVLFDFDLTESLDGDDLPDWWERLHGLDPLDPSDELGDPDGDRYPNLYEYTHGTNPSDAQSTPTPTHYVSLAGSHAPPFASWATAATNIQSALDAATNAYDIVAVADGVYTGAPNRNISFPSTPCC